MDNPDNVLLTRFNHAIDPQYCPHCNTYHKPNQLLYFIGYKELTYKPTWYRVLYPGKDFKAAVFKCLTCFKYYWYHKMVKEATL
jgi:hypothetical protein